MPLSRPETTRQADTLRIEDNAFYPWGRGGFVKPAGGGLTAPATACLHYAGKIRATPGNSAFHANKFRSLFLVFSAIFYYNLTAYNGFMYAFVPLYFQHDR